MKKNIIKTLASIALICSGHGLTNAQNISHPIEHPNHHSIKISTERMVLVRLYEAESRLQRFQQVFLDNNPNEQAENLNRIKAQMNYISIILNARDESYAIMQKGLDVLEKYQALLDKINQRDSLSNKTLPIESTEMVNLPAPKITLLLNRISINYTIQQYLSILE